MTWDKIVVDVGGLALIGFIVWFFWLKKEQGVRAALTSGGWQEQMILVKGGYTPDTVVAVAGKPLRLIFQREEASPCSEMVVFDAFRKSAALPEGEAVPVELVPSEPGEYQFACGMGMLRGRLVVE